MAHGDAVVHADRVENKRRAAGLDHALLDELANLIEMHMARNDIDVAVANGDERLCKIAILQSRGSQKTTMGGAGIAQLDDIGSHSDTGPFRDKCRIPLLYATAAEDQGFKTLVAVPLAQYAD